LPRGSKFAADKPLAVRPNNLGKFSRPPAKCSWPRWSLRS